MLLIVRWGMAAAAAAAMTIAIPAALATAPGEAAVSGMRPLEDFARLPSMGAPMISPSGHAVAAQVAVDGETVLAVIPLDGSKRRVASAGRNDINWFRWVNDDWLAVGIGQTALVEGQEVYARRLLRVSADMQTREIVPRRGSAIHADGLVWAATDGSPRVLLARQTSIYWGPGWFPEVVEVDLSTGMHSRAAASTPQVYQWAADDSGQVRAGVRIADGGRVTQLLYRDRGGGKWRTISRADSRRKEGLIVPTLFLPQPGKALVFADDDDGYRGVFEMDLETLERGAPLFVRKGHDVSGLIRLPDSPMPVGYAVWEDTLRHHWQDPDLAEVQRSLDKAVGAGKRATIGSISRDRVRMTVLVDSASEPGRWYVLDRAEERMVPLGWINETFKTPMHPVRTIRYKARDGLEIPAILTLPRGRENGRGLPLVVMPHGGPQARDTEDWDWWAQFLADRGYVVVQPNYRGSTGYGKAFLEAGEGQWGLAMQDDLNDAVTHLAATGLIDAKKVCMVGGSYGGYAAMRAAQRDGHLYRCAVSFAGVSDMPRLLRYDRQFLWGAAAADYLREQAPDLSGVSPINFVEQVSIPILLVHGRDDGRVPLVQSRAFADRLAKAGKPHRYVEQPKGDHSLSRQEDRVQFLKELEAFLMEHNPA